MAMAQWQVGQLEYERELFSWFAPIASDQVAQMLIDAGAPMSGATPDKLEAAARTISQLKYWRQVTLTSQVEAFHKRTKRLGEAVGSLKKEFGPAAISAEALSKLRDRKSKRDLNPLTPGAAEVRDLWAVYRLLTGGPTFSKNGPSTRFIAAAIKAAGWKRKLNTGSIANALREISGPTRNRLP
jgi:hypothetical protein